MKALTVVLAGLVGGLIGGLVVYLSTGSGMITEAPAGGRQLISSGTIYEEYAGYSRAVAVGDTIYVSGTVGMDPETQSLPEGAAAQAQQSIANIRRALREADAELDDIVSMTICITDPAALDPVISVLREHFEEIRPANMTFRCELFAAGALVEIQATAVRR